MKTLSLLLALIILTNCSTHTVKLGKKCTKVASDNTYEKSFIWSVDRTMSDDAFGRRISKQNCPKIAKKS